MSLIKTEYRGYTITYREDENVWRCAALNDNGGSSLLAVKGKIDKLHLELRKEAAVPAYFLGFERREECRVIEYLGQNISRERVNGEYVNVPSFTVAVLSREDGKSKWSRSIKNLRNLIPATPEAEKAWEEYLRLKAEIAAASRKAEKALEAIPRLTIEEIQGLVALADPDGSASEGGDA